MQLDNAFSCLVGWLAGHTCLWRASARRYRAFPLLASSCSAALQAASAAARQPAASAAGRGYISTLHLLYNRQACLTACNINQCGRAPGTASKARSPAGSASACLISARPRLLSKSSCCFRLAGAAALLPARLDDACRASAPRLYCSAAAPYRCCLNRALPASLHCSAAWLAAAPALPAAAACLAGEAGGAWPAPEAARLLFAAAISALILQARPCPAQHDQHTRITDPLTGGS